MHPAFLDAMSWEMAEVYGAITDQILINLARHFPFYVAGEDLPKSAFAYQAKMLAQMGQVNAETMRIIRNGLADADPALVNCLEQSIIDAVNGADKDLAKAVKKGIFAPPAAPVLSPNQYKAFNLYYTQAADKLNLVNTVMLESTQSAYRQAVSDVVSEIEIADRINRTQIALDAAAGETVTGVSSWNQALRHAADKLNDGGIVGFIDHAGRRWSAEAYVAMDIRTTVFNTGRAAVWETNQNFGNDLYSVSYHNGARPLCYPWQNKVISSLDAARTVIDLDGNEIEVIAQSATSYGAPAGLFGINCKHYPTPFIPGVSVLTGQPQSKEENERVYAESQTQREMERTLREQKRDYLTAKAQGRPQEELDYLQGKCRETSGQIDEFCKKTGRARHRDREGVYTKREFPDAKKYDVTAFERDQKKMIDGFFDKGGAQQNFTAGQMTPNVPLVPKTPTPAPVTPAPVTPVAPTAPATPQNVASQATQTAGNMVQSTSGEKSEIVKRLEASNVENRPVKPFDVQPTEEEIIARVGGADQTKGSCASLAWTYAGNKNGIDVLDFRGGASEVFFSNRRNGISILDLDGVVGKVVKKGNDFAAVHELQKVMEEGKEYIIATGRHASVVRKVGEGYQYLELQSATNNGWHTLDDAVLKWRFACKRSHTTYGYKFELDNLLVNVESLKRNKEFETVLGYINTAADAQRKGVGGGIK
jgi:hypothetical protein